MCLKSCRDRFQIFVLFSVVYDPVVMFYLEESTRIRDAHIAEEKYDLEVVTQENGEATCFFGYTEEQTSLEIIEHVPSKFHSLALKHNLYFFRNMEWTLCQEK